MTDVAQIAAQPRRILWGRIISLLGAAGLCVSFFLPHFQGIAAPIETLVFMDSFDDPMIIIPFFAAALLVPLVAFRAVPRVDAAKGAAKFLAWAQFATCLLALLTSLGSLTYGFILASRGSAILKPIAYAMVPVGVAGLVLAAVALVRSPLPGKAATAMFALWAYYLTLFAWAAVDWVDIHFGMWVSLAACGALVLGSAIDWFQCRPARASAPA